MNFFAAIPLGKCVFLWRYSVIIIQIALKEKMSLAVVSI